MRIILDVDDVGRRYLATREAVTSIPAVDLVAVRGVYCRACKGGAPTKVKVGDASKPGRWTWSTVCVSCRQAWEGVPVEIMRRWVQAPSRSNGVERRLLSRIDEWGALRGIVEPAAERDADGVRFIPGRWTWSVRCWLVYGQAQWGTYDRVCEFGLASQLDQAELFTQKRVRDAIRKVRGVMRARAVDAGMMIGGAR